MTISLQQRVDCFLFKIRRLLYFVIVLFWDILVTVGIGFLFALWWGFLFGSVIAVILVLIFVPEYFLLPLLASVFYKNPILSYNNICLKSDLSKIYTKETKEEIKKVQAQANDLFAKASRGEILKDDDYDILQELQPNDAIKLLKINEKNIKRVEKYKAKD